jgi:hypothetical protein
MNTFRFGDYFLADDEDPDDCSLAAHDALAVFPMTLRNRVDLARRVSYQVAHEILSEKPRWFLDDLEPGHARYLVLSRAFRSARAAQQGMKRRAARAGTKPKASKRQTVKTVSEARATRSHATFEHQRSGVGA